jgi:hypothetical protein
MISSSLYYNPLLVQSDNSLHNANIYLLIEQDAALLNMQFEKHVQICADCLSISFWREAYDAHSLSNRKVLLIPQIL